jgi:hypothetical protein
MILNKFANIFQHVHAHFSVRSRKCFDIFTRTFEIYSHTFLKHVHTHFFLKKYSNQFIQNIHAHFLNIFKYDVLHAYSGTKRSASGLDREDREAKCKEKEKKEAEKFMKLVAVMRNQEGVALVNFGKVLCDGKMLYYVYMHTYTCIHVHI